MRGDNSESLVSEAAITRHWKVRPVIDFWRSLIGVEFYRVLRRENAYDYVEYRQLATSLPYVIIFGAIVASLINSQTTINGPVLAELMGAKYGAIISGILEIAALACLGNYYFTKRSSDSWNVTWDNRTKCANQKAASIGWFLGAIAIGALAGVSIGAITSAALEDGAIVAPINAAMSYAVIAGTLAGTVLAFANRIGQNIAPYLPQDRLSKLDKLVLKNGIYAASGAAIAVAIDNQTSIGGPAAAAAMGAIKGLSVSVSTDLLLAAIHSTKFLSLNAIYSLLVLRRADISMSYFMASFAVWPLVGVTIGTIFGLQTPDFSGLGDSIKSEALPLSLIGIFIAGAYVSSGQMGLAISFHQSVIEKFRSYGNLPIYYGKGERPMELDSNSEDYYIGLLSRASGGTLPFANPRSANAAPNTSSEVSRV